MNKVPNIKPLRLKPLTPLRALVGPELTIKVGKFLVTLVRQTRRAVKVRARRAKGAPIEKSYPVGTRKARERTTVQLLELLGARRRSKKNRYGVLSALEIMR